MASDNKLKLARTNGGGGKKEEEKTTVTKAPVTKVVNTPSIAFVDDRGNTATPASLANSVNTRLDNSLNTRIAVTDQSGLDAARNSMATGNANVSNDIPVSTPADDSSIKTFSMWQDGDAGVPEAKVGYAPAVEKKDIIPISYPEYDMSIWTEATNRIQNELDALKSGRTSYTEQMLDAMNAYRNRDAFSYDPNSDPLFQSALASAMNSGKSAMQDTMGQAAGLTGGYGSSYATTAANQAYNAFVEGAYDNIADYYNMALNQYNMEGQQLLNTYDMLAQQDSNEWNRAYSSLQTDIDMYNSQFTNSLNAYNANRSNFYDAATFNEGVREYEQDYAEGVRRYDQDFNEGVREFDLGYNEGVREFVLGYNEGVREWDESMDLNERKLAQDNEQYYAGLAQDDEQFKAQEARLNGQNAMDEKMWLAQYGAQSWKEFYDMLDNGDLVSVGGKLMSADEAASQASGTKALTASQMNSIIEDSVKEYERTGSYDTVIDNPAYADMLTDEDIMAIDEAVRNGGNLPYSKREYDATFDNRGYQTGLKTGDTDRDFEANVTVSTTEKIDGKNKKVSMSLNELRTKFIESEINMGITEQTAESDWEAFKKNLMTDLLANGNVLKGWINASGLGQDKKSSVLDYNVYNYTGY